MVLVTRQDQVPKVTREGDPSLAGKVAPQIVQDHLQKPNKVHNTVSHKRVRNDKKEREQQKKKKRDQKQERKEKGNILDIRV